jgi:prolyl oligopeptidase PreP (S9A serine peptidase family)
VPYFVVWPPATSKRDGKNPTLLYGYGGFEVSMTPGYSAGVGAAWLEQRAACTWWPTSAAAASSARAGTRRR